MAMNWPWGPHKFASIQLTCDCDCNPDATSITATSITASTRPLSFIMATFNDNFIMNTTYHDYLAILKGARNGFVYGVKVRFPHALVMSILFGRGRFVLFISVKSPQVISSTIRSHISTGRVSLPAGKTVPELFSRRPSSMPSISPNL